MFLFTNAFAVEIMKNTKKTWKTMTKPPKPFKLQNKHQKHVLWNLCHLAWISSVNHVFCFFCSLMVWEAWSWFFMLSLCFFMVCSKSITTLRFLNTPQSLTLFTYIQTYSESSVQNLHNNLSWGLYKQTKNSLTYWDIHDLTHLCLCYRSHEKNTKKAWQTMTKLPKPCKIAK